MSQRPPTLLEVLEAAVDGSLADVRVSLPGRIEAYNATTRRATVQVLVKDGVVDETEARKGVALPPLPDVPVAAWGSGAVRIKLTPQPGDPCWLLFSSSSIARLKASDGRTVVDPGDDRRHHLADAIAIPCVTVGAAGSAPLIEFTDAAVLVGSSSAAQESIRGTAYRAAEDTLNTAWNVWLTANGVFIAALGAVPGMAAAATTMQAANAALITALASYVAAIAGPLSLTSTVKVP